MAVVVVVKRIIKRGNDMKTRWIVVSVAVVMIAMAICLPVGWTYANPEAEPVGLLGMGEDDAWVVYHSNKVDTFKMRYIGFGCTQEIMGKCVSGNTVAAPDVGELYTLTGNQKWQNGVTQDIRWEETTGMKCGFHLPITVKEPQPVCGCQGYSVKVKRDSDLMFQLPMLAAPEYGQGGSIRVTSPQVVTVNYRWNEDVLGKDPCLKSYELKVQCPSFSKVIPGKDSKVQYDCGTLNYSTVSCTAMATVSLTTGEVCQSKWQTIDP